MKRRVLAAAFLAAACAATPAAAYEVCLFSNTNKPTYYVLIGGYLLTFAGQQAPCQEVGVTGAVRGGQSLSEVKDCAFSVPEGNTRAIQIAIATTDPGIGGIQPILSCTGTLL